MHFTPSAHLYRSDANAKICRFVPWSAPTQRRWFSFDPRTLELSYFLSDKHPIPHKVLVIQSCEVAMVGEGSSMSFGFLLRTRNSVSADNTVVAHHPQHAILAHACLSLLCDVMLLTQLPSLTRSPSTPCSPICYCSLQVKTSAFFGCGLFKMLLPRSNRSPVVAMLRDQCLHPVAFQKMQRLSRSRRRNGCLPPHATTQL